MKVILLQDVAKIGRRSEVVEVPDGYARNQLIPKKMAEPATPANLKRIERMKANSAAEADAETEKYVKTAEALKDMTVTVETEVNEQGHLFKAVSPEDVAAAAKGAGIEVDPKLITIPEPIKEAGEHTIILQHGNERSEVQLVVTKKA